MKISKRELENLKYYVDEKERLMKEIDNYNDMYTTGYKSQDFTTPKGTNGDNDFLLKVIIHNERVQKEIKKRLNKIEIIIIRLYKTINKIEDPELKSIVELRAIKGLTWEKIGEEMHMEKTTAFKKYKAFVDD